MCRVLTYLGHSIFIEDLLYKPDNSFIKQSYHPKYMPHLLNLAGFGMVAWDAHSHNPTLPFIYKTDSLPFYDENLRNLTQKIKPNCLLTHIRGVAYSEDKVVSKQNVHPFKFPGSPVAFAHNGALYNFDAMKYDLLDYIHMEWKEHIQGTTDSEWLYALLMSQFPKTTVYSSDDIIYAVYQTLTILKKVRYKHNIGFNSPVNIFISNGEFIAATRFVFDFGWIPPNQKKQESAHFIYHSLWYTYGESYEFIDDEYKMKGGKTKSSIIIASEPLTEDTTTWIEVPEYTLMIAKLDNNEIHIQTRDIDLT